MTASERKQIEQRYVRAYANVHGEPPRIQCERGWYRLNGRGNYRASDLVTMAENLERRAGA